MEWKNVVKGWRVSSVLHVKLNMKTSCAMKIDVSNLPLGKETYFSVMRQTGKKLLFLVV